MLIKLIIGLFDGDSFRRIRVANDGKKRDKLTAVWFELLELAGRGNSGGVLTDKRGTPLATAEDIAPLIYRKAKEVSACLEFFEAEGMVTHDGEQYAITNWSVYQNTAELDTLREKNRQRQREYRARQREAKTAEVQKTSYGKHGNVMMTEEEVAGLVAEHGQTTVDKAIDYLDAYIAEKGYKSQNHAVALSRWVIGAVKKAEQDQKPTTKRTTGIQQPSGTFSAAEWEGIRQMQEYMQRSAGNG